MRFFGALFFLLASLAVVSLLFWEPHADLPTEALGISQRFDSVESQYQRRPDLEVSKPLFITAPAPRKNEKRPSVSSIIQSSLIPPEQGISESLDLFVTSKTVETIQAELDTLPLTADYAAARTVLLNAASTLPMDDQDIVDQVHDMALQELFDPALPANSETTEQGLKSFSSFLPIVAHELLLRTADDEQEALIVTLQGMAYQQDLAVRRSLLTQFLQYYPDSEAVIREEVSNRDLLQTSAIGTELQ